MTMDEEYDVMIIEGRTNEEDEVIYKYLNVNLIFDISTNNERCGTIVKRYRGLDGREIGFSHTNPFFDTREYDIEFTYGMWDKYAAKIITENMYAQVNNEGHQYQLLAEIQDHQKVGMTI